MKKKWLEMKEHWGSLVLGACVVVLFYVALANIGIVWDGFKAVIRVFVPVYIGIGIAYVLNPFANINNRTVFKKIKNRKISWYLSVVLAIILLLLVIALLLYSLIPQIVGSIINFVENIEGYLASLKEFVNSLNLPPGELVDTIQDLINNEGKLLSRALELLVGNIGSIGQRASTITADTVNVGIGFILAIYFLCDKQKMLEWLRNLLKLLVKEEPYNRFLEVGSKFNVIFARYIGCELIDALIVGIVNYIFMTICGMPYAILVSVVVGIANLVPTFGPIVGAVIGGFILLLANPVNALWFLVFTIILQTIDGYWIKPRLFGDALNVPGVLIIIAIIVICKIFGVVGIFLSIPFAAIMVYIFQNFILTRLEARKARMKEAKTSPILEKDDVLTK